MEHAQVLVRFVEKHETMSSCLPPDPYRLIATSLEAKRVGWIEAAEQVGEFLFHERDCCPMAINSLTDRQMEAIGS